MVLSRAPKAILMPNGLEELRVIERLLCQAEARLGSLGTFRQRTLLQMTLFEVRRGLQAPQREDAVQPPIEAKDDAVKR
ncbi:hypothetical protein [Methylobacterium sp. B4]|nr:hypothetical protein [Methylobacterium sp. B4]